VAGLAEAGLTEQIGATFEILARELAHSLRPVEGLVVSVDGERIFVDLSEKDGITPGVDLQVFRKGEVFRHPVTNQPLGRYEEQLGQAQIVRVFPSYSEARFISLDGKPTPRPEDGVRITKGRLRVAVAPLLDLTGSPADARRVPYMIALTLERTKRFDVVDPLKVHDLFAAMRGKTEELLNSPDRAVTLGRELQIAGWIVPVLLERRGATHVDAIWISALTGTALLSKRQPLAPPRLTDERRFPWEPPPGD
jgi:hypothetical protein